MSTTTNNSKTKYKLAFLGNQSVGKSSIIEKYINDKFSEESNVREETYSPLLVSTTSPRLFTIILSPTACSCGTQQAKRDSSR